MKKQLFLVSLACAWGLAMADGVSPRANPLPLSLANDQCAMGSATSSDSATVDQVQWNCSTGALFVSDTLKSRNCSFVAESATQLRFSCNKYTYSSGSSDTVKATVFCQTGWSSVVNGSIWSCGGPPTQQQQQQRSQ